MGFFAAFNVFPMLFGLYLSFTDYDLLNPPLWVGLDNFANLLSDKLFLTALRNTLMFVAGATLPVWVLSLLAALLFDQAFRGRDIAEGRVLSAGAAADRGGRGGLAVLLHPNGVMTSLIGGRWGMTEIRWLADAVLAPLSMIAVHDWAAIPFFMVIWLAGLAGIPPSSARPPRSMARVRCAPSGISSCRTCASTAVLVAALSSINAFQTFALQYVLPTDPGGPANSTLVLGLLVLKYGFQYFRMGDAAAVSMVMFAMICSSRSCSCGSTAVRERPVRLLMAVVAAAIFAFPIWFMASSAFKAEAEVQAIPMHFFPHDFQGLAQFRQAAEIAPLWRYFLNSWIYAASHVGITVFFGALAGFGFAKYRFPGRTLLFLAVLSTIMVPFQVLVVPLFVEVKCVRLGEQLCRASHPRDDERVRRVHDAAIRVGPAGRTDRGGACRWRRRIPHLPAHRAASAAAGAGQPRDHRVHLVVGRIPLAAGDRAGQGSQRAVGRA